MVLIVLLIALFRMNDVVDIHDAMMVAGRDEWVTVPYTTAVWSVVRLLSTVLLAVSLSGLGTALALGIGRVPTLVWVIVAGAGILTWASLAVSWSPAAASGACLVLFTVAAVLIHGRFGEV